jgi:hypothetical protein
MRRTIVISFLFFSLLVTTADTYAQCAMCRRVAETSQTGNSRKGLNAGILYLLSIPYVMGGIGLFVWHKNKKK